jgi:hypothetical protein
MDRISLRNMILLSIILGTITSIYVYLKKKPTKIKQQEEKLSFKEKIYLYANRTIHYILDYYYRLYPFICQMTIFNDFLLLIFILMLFIQWSILSECSLSNAEKKLLNPKYITGSDIKYQPYTSVLFDDNNILSTFWNVIFKISFFIVIFHFLFFHNYQEIIKFKKYTPLKYL